MKKILLLLALLASALSVRAEENAAKLALAREAISAMQIDKMLDGMSGQIKQMALQQAQPPAAATEEQKKQFAIFMDKVADISMAEMKTMFGKLDTVYAEVYSEAELKAIVAFFKSPEGQSMVAKQPQVMAHLMPLMQEMQRSMMGKIQKLAEEFKAKTQPAAAK